MLTTTLSYLILFVTCRKKTDSLSRLAWQVGLQISATSKTKVLPVNISPPLPTKIGQLHLHGNNPTIHLFGSKARGAFTKLWPVWRSKTYSRGTKIKIYQACIISVYLNGSEFWGIIVHDLKKLQSFHTSCLRKIMHIFWPEKISNNELFNLTEQENMEIVLTRRRWTWIGPVLRREATNISRVALRWTPEGKRKRGRPKSTWRRTAEAELQSLNLYWGTSFTACIGPTGKEKAFWCPMYHSASKELMMMIGSGSSSSWICKESVQPQIEIRTFSRHRSRSLKYAEFSHFTLLFCCRERPRNVLRFQMHAQSYCSAH